ncbi:MAG: asparaginase [Actinomadura sp.]
MCLDGAGHLVVVRGHRSVAGLLDALLGAVTRPGRGGPARAVADAMRAHPEYVGGTGHVNTELMRALPGAVVKGGAEGVIIAATARGHAVAVKVIDGGLRATTAIALRALGELGADVAPAAPLGVVPILGGGDQVGEIHATVSKGTQ